MLIIMGKTASGKDTIVNELVSKHGFKKVVTYTTRPMRKNEKQDITYHFISEEDFDKKVQNGFFAEWKSYDTEFGVWHYGSALSDFGNGDDKTVAILTPDGYRDVLSKLYVKPKSIYVYADNSTIKKRLLLRGDDEAEAHRRLKHDNEDFKGLENEVDRIVFNDWNTNIDDIINIIVYG